MVAGGSLFKFRQISEKRLREDGLPPNHPRFEVYQKSTSFQQAKSIFLWKIEYPSARLSLPDFLDGDFPPVYLPLESQVPRNVATLVSQ